MINFKQILLAASLSVLSGIVSAVPITGGINFSGNLTTDTNDALTATVFTFSNPVSVGFADGSFSSLFTETQPITYSILDLNGAFPLAPLWSASNMAGDVFSFDLDSITSSTDGAVRNLKGLGVVTINGASADYVWNFSTQNPGLGNQPLTFTFSASQAQVSEPALALLLGTGLLGLGFSRKLRKKA